MVIDDNGKGLSTTGLGHGDAQHHGDLDPYRWGQEIYTCQEEKPYNCYRDGTTSKIYYRAVGSNDDGRCMAGNFCNDYPGAMGLSARDEAISCVTNGHISGLTKSNVTQNFRIYWDGDLLEETFDYSSGKNTAGHIMKYGKGEIALLSGSMTNNDTKGTPCFQGDILGDWREEVIMRTAQNNIRIYTTNFATPWRNYTLWHDHQYRNAMVWQMCGYNQPPHVSYFLGELEGITAAPPALTMTGRTEVQNGGTIDHQDQTVITCETGDMTVTVAEGAAPYIYIDNAPSWVQGTGSTSTTAPVINYTYYTHTLKGAAFTGAMRLVKQGDGTLVLPSVVQTYTGPTDVWAGTLQFDGTLQKSRLWLNRHTMLVSNGGRFQTVQADYNATLQPGGDGSVGTITADSLILNFGSRVVFDIDGTQIDQLNVAALKIEKKVWPNGGGPAYDAPVFRIQGTVADGKYALATVGKIEGDISDIVIEGQSDMKTALSYEDGKLWLTVQHYEASDIAWTGATNGTWDIDATSNFQTHDGQSAVFVPGSAVTFDDNAQQTTINIVGNVAPGSVVFNNSTKAFTLTGDSIVGEPTLTKNGAGQVTISNQNHLGNTVVNEGTLVVSSLANNSGTDYGALGDVKKTVTIRGGGQLTVSETATSDQSLIIGEGGGRINVNSGKTFSQSGSIAGAGQTLTKGGAGTLTLGTNVSVGKLVISSGAVNAQLNSSTRVALPATVEFRGGTLNDPNNQSAYASNTTNFVVQEGQSGTLLCDPRCEYTGTLTGAGTFTVIAGGVRGYFEGDWSQFEGIVVPGLQKRGSYDPSFDYRNAKGLPKAILRLNSGVTFNSDVNLALGSVTGTGTLGGTVTYTIGSLGTDIYAQFSSSAPIVKTGAGDLRVASPGKLKGTLRVQEGTLLFDDDSKTTAFFGGLTLTGSAQLKGNGLIQSLTMESGTVATPCSVIDFLDEPDTLPATLKTSAAVNVKSGASLLMLINGTNSYSVLLPRFLTFNGTLRLKLGKDYTPKAGDEFTLWSGAGSFSGTPKYDLPELPDGLYWDTRAVPAATGVLRITDDATVGIGRLAADAQVVCEVYTLTGVRVADFQAVKKDIAAEARRQGIAAGTYVVRYSDGRRAESDKLVIR